MGNCLVTKLKGVVDNDMLVHLGNAQLVIEDWSAWNAAVWNDTSGEEVTFKIKSDHEFTDATHQQHLGKEIVVSAANTRTVMRFNALNGETGPVVVELGPKSRLVTFEGNYPLNNESTGYTGLTSINCTVDVSPNNFAKLFPKVRSYLPYLGNGGNIIGLEEWDSLVSVSGNNNFIGALEDIFVAKYNRPQSVQRIGVRRFSVTGTSQEKSPTFNGIAYPSQEVLGVYSDSSPYIKVKLGGESGTILGTWDGTSWTYA